MVPISREQIGDLLALWLQKSCSIDPLKQIVKDTGYNDSPFFGAEKKKVRVMGELVFANTSLAIFAVNQVFEVDDAKAIIDTFLDRARKSMFTVLEAKDQTFKERYQRRLEQYFKSLSEARALIGMSCLFMENLDLDPLKHGEGQMKVAARFGQSLTETVDVLKRLSGAQKPSAESPGDSVPVAVETPAVGRKLEGFIGMMDIDNFDFINDKLGRVAGDQVMNAYKRLTASLAQTDVILSEDGFRAFQAQTRGENVPGGDFLRSKVAGKEFVLSFPYSSGDEFVVHHHDEQRIRKLLEGIQQTASKMDISIVDASGRSIAVLHGIPISIGHGPSWKEAWEALVARKGTGRGRGMAERIEVLRTAGAGSDAPPAVIASTEDALGKAAAKIFRDGPQTDRATGLPTTLDIRTETTPEGLIPVVMWGPVETRRPGWTKEHQRQMYREILAHMRSLGISDLERFKETAQEVSELTDQLWRTTVRSMASKK